MDMNLTTIIMELGGIGAVVSLFTNLIQGYRQARLDEMKFQREQARIDKGEEDKDNADKRSWLDKSEVGAWVHRVLVITALAIISSTVWAPLFFDNVAVTWYWPKEGSFLFWSWENLKPLTVGSVNATKHIAILPIHIAMVGNILSFYLVNRPFKRLTS
jgi:hypothetical protein